MINWKTLRQHGPAGVVFGVAAWQSYWHTVEVATRYGEAASAYLMPLSIDGLMIVAARYISHAKTRAGKALAGVAFAFAVVAMAGANVLAAEPGIVSAIVAVWPALAMVAVGAMLHWSPQRAQPVRRTRRPANVTPIKSREKKSA